MTNDIITHISLPDIDVDVLLIAFDHAKASINAADIDDKARRGWLNALIKALNWCLVANDTIELNTTTRTAKIPGSNGKTYEANGKCQCRSSHGYCWHRAAARLLYRYNKAVYKKAIDEINECFCR